jgi:hypothetical protein
MTKDEALKLALEALECALSDGEPYIVKSKEAITAINQALAQPEERNFCPRCGKRRGGDVNYIHTCTPPVAADPKAFHGFPSGSVSTPNAGGKCVTAGETAP